MEAFNGIMRRHEGETIHSLVANGIINRDVTEAFDLISCSPDTYRDFETGELILRIDHGRQEEARGDEMTDGDTELELREAREVIRRSPEFARFRRRRF